MSASEQRRLQVTYRRWGPKDVERRLDPIGLVLKVGNWYLVARSTNGSDPQGQVRTCTAAAGVGAARRARSAPAQPIPPP
jgi:hypothetical protein